MNKDIVEKYTSIFKEELYNHKENIKTKIFLYLNFLMNKDKMIVLKVKTEIYPISKLEVIFSNELIAGEKPVTVISFREHVKNPLLIKLITIHFSEFQEWGSEPTYEEMEKQSVDIVENLFIETIEEIKKENFVLSNLKINKTKDFLEDFTLTLK